MARRRSLLEMRVGELEEEVMSLRLRHTRSKIEQDLKLCDQARFSEEIASLVFKDFRVLRDEIEQAIKDRVTSGKGAVEKKVETRLYGEVRLYGKAPHSYMVLYQCRACGFEEWRPSPSSPAGWTYRAGISSFHKGCQAIGIGLMVVVGWDEAMTEAECEKAAMEETRDVG